MSVASSNIRITVSSYWLGSTNDIDTLWCVDNSGSIYGNSNVYCWGVRSVVFLEPGVYIASGDGIEASPYVFEKE